MSYVTQLKKVQRAIRQQLLSTAWEHEILCKEKEEILKASARVQIFNVAGSESCDDNSFESGVSDDIRRFIDILRARCWNNKCSGETVFSLWSSRPQWRFIVPRLIPKIVSSRFYNPSPSSPYIPYIALSLLFCLFSRLLLCDDKQRTLLLVLLT